MDAQVLDYRSPSVTVSTGTPATTDNEPMSTTVTSAFNPSTGAYVVASTASGVALQLQFPGGVTTRYRPVLKVTGWPGSSVQVQLGGATLTLGTDYQAAVDAASGTLRVVLLKDIAPST